MVARLPAEESITIFNRLLDLDGSQVEEIGRAEWRLRVLRGKRPSDQRIAMAHLKAKLMLGHAEEAAALADMLWAMRFNLAPEVRESLTHAFFEIGMFERARYMLGTIEDMTPADWRMARCMQVAIAQGDVDAMKQVINIRIAHDGDSDDVVLTFLEQIEAEGLLRHFSDHQGIVNSVVRGIQTGRASIIRNLEDSGCELINYIFVGADRDERRRLESEIDEQLEAYYEAAGLEPAAFVPRIVTLVMNAKAEWRKPSSH